MLHNTLSRGFGSGLDVAGPLGWQSLETGKEWRAAEK